MRTRRPFTIILLMLMAFSVQGGFNFSHASSAPPYFTYLPFVSQFDPAGQPRLIFPTNGAILDTLIPDFRWNNGVQPSNASGCLGLSTAPHPGCWLYLSIDSNVEQDWLSWGNLEPHTIYYWRVGAVYNDDYDHPLWSDEWYFRTGPAGGTILPAPNLLSPADNAVLDISNLIFTWTPVPGSVQYDYELVNDAASTGYLFFTTPPQIDFRNMTSYFTSKSPYHWQVRARNNYAWGSYSTTRYFTVSFTQSPGFLTENLILPLFYQHQSGGRTIMEPLK